jgi:paired amphipathic helix protein Sin3a
MNIPFLPFTDNNRPSSSTAGDHNTVVLSDVIGKQRAINIFASFTRDVDSILRRLEDKAQNTTVLAPLNSQVEKLPRKPWEDPRDYETLGESAYEGDGGEDRANRNLKRFVEAHLLPVSPWREGEKVDSLGGGELWWEEKEGKKLVRRCGSGSVTGLMP